MGKGTALTLTFANLSTVWVYFIT